MQASAVLRFKKPVLIALEIRGKLVILDSLIACLINYSLQLMVQCYDTANPSQHAQEVVVITVNRNPNAPQFTPLNVTVTIPDSTPINTLVTQLNATDADGVSLVVNFYK